MLFYDLHCSELCYSLTCSAVCFVFRAVFTVLSSDSLKYDPTDPEHYSAESNMRGGISPFPRDKAMPTGQEGGAGPEKTSTQLSRELLPWLPFMLSHTDRMTQHKKSVDLASLRLSASGAN